jgi:hypothetical protein
MRFAPTVRIERLRADFGFRETARTAHEGYDRATSITMSKVLR